MKTLAWLRRDLRLHDHAALHAALQMGASVQPVFIFDTDILKHFPDKHDRRVTFIAATLIEMDNELRKLGGGLLVLHGRAQEIIPALASSLDAHVVAAEDYEPGAIARDEAVAKKLGAKFTRVKDHVIFSGTEVLKDDGTPFKVYTPYSKAWRARISPASFAPYGITLKGRLADFAPVPNAVPLRDGLEATLKHIGYAPAPLGEWSVDDAQERLKKFTLARMDGYKDARDLMGESGTSKLSPYLRFGLISVREAFAQAFTRSGAGATTWQNELIWREFYSMILFHAPHSATQEWNAAYRGKIAWRNEEAEIAAWKEGKTGYPIVDAAMRELRDTGWMHNRARMIAASFFTKHLLADWRIGEAHFAQLLMDYDMASNVGGWQWAASTGTDAQPYFRIFNPVLQSKKFDPKGAYIHRFVPELRALSGEALHMPWKYPLEKPADYPLPIVNHEIARAQALAAFKKLS